MAPSRLLALLLSVTFIQLAVAGTDSSWLSAQATVYGDNSGTINGGACGYGDLYNNGYGSNTAAISSALFNGGSGCGSCFEIKCDASAAGAGKRCLPEGQSVVVTATNFCPPSDAQYPDAWCNPPHKHFDMADAAFSQIATYSSGGAVPVKFRNVPCSREGGIRFTVNGNSRYNLVLLTNVGGTGEVKSVSVRGSKTGWTPLSRSWGSNWQTQQDMRGQSLSFQVLLSDGTTVTSYDVAPASWQLGQTFEGKQVP